MSKSDEEKILESPVILRENLKETYGIMKIEKYHDKEIGSIVEDLLQNDVIIEFETEEEKDKIISIVPTNFKTQIEGNCIIISFEKEEIEAPLYSKQNVSDYFNRSHTEFKSLGIGKIVGTIKTAELTRSISEFKSKVHQIKAEIYKANTETYNKDKIKATSRIEDFFYWLNKTGEIEILDSKLISGKGAETFAGVRRSFTDKSIYYKFKNEDEIYTAVEPDGDFIEENKYGERIEKLYNKFIEEMKENGEYYIPGTFVPRHRITKENGIYYSEGFSSDNKSAVILKKGEPCLILDDIETNHREKFCKHKTKPFIYVSAENNPKGYEELPQEECLVGRRGGEAKELESSGWFYNIDWLVHSDKDTLSYYSNENEISMEKESDESSIPEIIHLYGGKHSVEKCNCIAICNGKKITVILNPGEYGDEERITEFEYEGKIDSIETHDNYIIINNNEIIMVEGEYYSKDTKLSNIKNIGNVQQIKAEYLSQSDFIKNDNGCFCIAGLTEQQKLELYEEQDFKELHEKLSAEIAKREKEEQEKAQAKLENDTKLSEYVGSAQALIVPVVFSNPDNDDKDEMNGAAIYDASKNEKIGATYYSDNPNVQALYGIQEKGWRGYAYRGMVINVEMARKLARAGKLHLNVPEEAMGRIIGSKGSNINFVTAKLREKGVDVSKIILHPKTKEEMRITLDAVEKSIRENKNKDHDEH